MWITLNHKLIRVLYDRNKTCENSKIFNIEQGRRQRLWCTVFVDKCVKNAYVDFTGVLDNVGHM